MSVMDLLRLVEYAGEKVSDDEIKEKLRELWALLKKRESDVSYVEVKV